MSARRVVSGCSRGLALVLGALAFVLALTVRVGLAHAALAPAATAATDAASPAKEPRAERLACGEAERAMAPPSVRLDGPRSREAHGRGMALLGPNRPARIDRSEALRPPPPRAPNASVSPSRARALLMVFLN